MKNSDFRPSKAMGQNFLGDENVARKIVRLSGIDDACGVLEVGPGLGALTSQLAPAARCVTAVELDTRLAAGLREVSERYPNVKIIQGDILKTDIRGLALETLPDTRRVVCANLPYSITTPAMTRLIEAGVFESMTVMVQKEVAQRICSAPGSAHYGAFTVFVNYHAEAPKILFDVPPECFTPRPKVTSCVVKMALRGCKLLGESDEQMFFRVVRAAFGQRRKTLVNALHAAFGSTHGKEAIAEAIESCGFDPKIRGEMLGCGDFIKLSSLLMQYNAVKLMQ